MQFIFFIPKPIYVHFVTKGLSKLKTRFSFINFSSRRYHKKLFGHQNVSLFIRSYAHEFIAIYVYFSIINVSSFFFFPNRISNFCFENLSRITSDDEIHNFFIHDALDGDDSLP